METLQLQDWRVHIFFRIFRNRVVIDYVVAC